MWSIGALRRGGNVLGWWRAKWAAPICHRPAAHASRRGSNDRDGRGPEKRAVSNEHPPVLIEPSSGTGAEIAVEAEVWGSNQAMAGHHIRLGIALMLVAILMFVINDALGKWLVATYSVGQVLLVRSLFGLAMLSPMMLRTGWRELCFPTEPKLHLLRVLLTTAEVAAFYWSVAWLPLADVVTFYMATPIFVTALAWRFLGEKLDWPRIAAIFAGFGGVLIAMRPSSASFSLPALVAIGGTFIFALTMVITRRLRGAKGIVLVAWQSGAALLFGLAASPLGWVTPGWRDFTLLGTLGIVATIAHMAVNRALKLAPASVVMPYQYTQIVWAILIGYPVFGDWPDAMMLAGSGVIVAAGMVILWRERGRVDEGSALI